MQAKRVPWVPDRQDIIWIDCNPQVSQEMRDVHPFLVLSPRICNAKTSLVIGLSMTTAHTILIIPLLWQLATRLPVVKRGKLVMCCVIKPKSFDWRLCKAKVHPLKNLSDALFMQVCERLNQIIYLNQVK